MDGTSPASTLAAWIAAHPALATPRRRWILGFSAGSDSTALLHAMLAWLREAAAQGGPQDVPRFTVAHLHHHLRGADADADARFAAETAAKAIRETGLERVAAFARADAVVPALMRARREGAEAAARDARLAWWSAFARRERAVGRPPPVVWLAHHADDQAETVLMRCARGSARRGRAGLRALQPFAFPAPDGGPAFWAARPWLARTKDDLLAYARRHGLAWREDASNDDPRHRRNALRLNAFPRLMARRPDARDRLLALARDAGEREAREGEHARRWLESAWRERADGTAVCWPPPAEMPVPVRKMALREAYERATGCRLRGRALLANLARLGDTARSGARISLPDGWVAVCEGGLIRFVRADAFRHPPSTVSGREAATFIDPEAGSGGCFLHSGPDGMVRMERAAFPGAPALRAAADPHTAWFPVNAMRGRLWIRPRRAGDAFRPFGGVGRRKVKDFLIDRRLSPPEKAAVRILGDDGGILWVWPLRVDERARIDASARRAWRIHWQPAT